jgi:hypothetical protein
VAGLEFGAAQGFSQAAPNSAQAAEAVDTWTLIKPTLRLFQTGASWNWDAALEQMEYKSL